jgi:tetratricopeptide (TPR) repeat protein
MNYPANKCTDIKTIMNEIIDFINRGEIEFFAGAGISFPYPSAKPISSNLKEAIWDNLLAYKRILRLFLSKENIRDEIKKIPLEMLNEIGLDEIGLNYLKLLNVLKNGKPNYNHRLLIWLLEKCLIKGKIINIWTTNFDYLLENCSQNIKTIYEDNGFKNYDRPTIYKIHGSLKDLESIQASVSDCQIGLSHNKKKLFKAMLEEKVFCFLGYSGNDIDIYNALIESNIRKIYWFMMPNDRPSNYLTELEKKYLEKLSIVNHNPTEFMILLGDVYGFSCPERELRNVKSICDLTYLKSWSRSIKMDSSYILGAVCRHVGYFKPLNFLYLTILLDSLRFLKAERIAKALIEYAKWQNIINNPRISLYILSFIRIALKIFRIKIPLEKLGIFFFHYGHTLQKVRRHKHSIIYFTKAVECFSKTIKQTKKVSDRKIMKKRISRCYQWIGVAYYFIGNFAKSILYLDKSIQLSKRLGDKPNELSISISKAVVLRWQGNYSVSLNIVGQVIEEAIYSGRISRAYAFCEKGFNESILGRYQDAEDSFIKSINEFKNVDPSDLGYAYIGLAAVYRLIDKGQESLDMVDNAIRNFKKYSWGWSQCHLERGETLKKFGNLNGARKNFLKILKYIPKEYLLYRTHASLGLAEVTRIKGGNSFQIYSKTLNEYKKMGIKWGKEYSLLGLILSSNNMDDKRRFKVALLDLLQNEHDFIKNNIIRILEDSLIEEVRIDFNYP